MEIPKVNLTESSLQTVGFWYLATPYSGHPDGLLSAHQDACEEAAVLLLAGINVFCPIAHSHSIAIHGGLNPLDYGIWMPADEPFMNHAVGLLVSLMEGWSESHGVLQEIKYFQKARKPIYALEYPLQLPIEED